MIKYQSAGSLQVEDVAIVLSGTEIVTGCIDRRSFEWSATILYQTTELGSDLTPFEATRAVPFKLALDSDLEPTFTFKHPSIGDVSNAIIKRSYRLAAVISLRSRNKVKATLPVTIVPDPSTVWHTAQPSASICASTPDPVGSPLARFLSPTR